MTLIHSPAFWREQWLTHNTGADRGYSSGAFWDTRVGDYDRKYDGESLEKIERFVDGLMEAKLFARGMRVLDLGCGPGRYTASFARRGAEVTALDISPGMLERTRENVPPDSRGRVTALQADWKDVDLAARGWEHAFDLVFARMTPAMDSPEGLDKFVAAGSHGCYLRVWAGKRPSAPLAALWELLSGAPRTERPSLFLCQLNYLLARGFHPALAFEEVRVNRIVPLTEAVASHTAYFSGVYGDSVPGLERKIADYIASVAVNGMVDETTSGQAAAMSWTLE